MSYTISDKSNGAILAFLSDLEINCLQVAIDDLIEFKRELISSEISDDDDLILECQHEHIDRLRAALKVRRKLKDVIA